MFKAIVFDFGNVLCGVDRMAFARAAAPYSAFTPKEVDAALWGGTLEHDFETGAFDSHEYFKRASALLRFSSEYQYETFATDYRRIIVPHPEGERGLKRADELGARTFILSNTSFLHASMIFSNEILASIPEQHILSYKIGVMKPDPRIWKVLLERSGLDARECVYIDDVEKYCAAARELGFNAIRYDKNEHNLSRIVEDVLQ